MSTSNSPAETPDFAAETNTASENTVASASTDSVLTGRQSSMSTLSWSIIKQSQQVMETPTNVSPMETDDRSRAPKRSDIRSNRSPNTSKSPRRTGNARGSEQHLAGRIDQPFSIPRLPTYSQRSRIKRNYKFKDLGLLKKRSDLT